MLGFEQIIAGLTNTNVLVMVRCFIGITHATWTGNMDSTAGAISEGRIINLIDLIRQRGELLLLVSVLLVFGVLTLICRAAAPLC